MVWSYAALIVGALVVGFGFRRRFKRVSRPRPGSRSGASDSWLAEQRSQRGDGTNFATPRLSLAVAIVSPDSNSQLAKEGRGITGAVWQAAIELCRLALLTAEHVVCDFSAEKGTQMSASSSLLRPANRGP